MSVYLVVIGIVLAVAIAAVLGLWILSLVG